VDKPQVIGLNKIDALDPADVKKLVTKLKRASKADVLPMSGAGGAGIDAVVDRLIEVIGPAEGAPARDDDTPPGEWSPV
jgi:GTP-binding protein